MKKCCQHIMSQKLCCLVPFYSSPQPVLFLSIAHHSLSCSFLQFTTACLVPIYSSPQPVLFLSIVHHSLSCSFLQFTTACLALLQTLLLGLYLQHSLSIFNFEANNLHKVSLFSCDLKHVNIFLTQLNTLSLSAFEWATEK